MASNTIHQPSPAKKIKLILVLHSTYGDWLGWSMDLNPIHHPSPAKKIKCSFLAQLSARGSVLNQSLSVNLTLLQSTCRGTPPPPRNEKVEILGQRDILVLADVPPPPPKEIKRLRSQVNMTFWFWFLLKIKKMLTEQNWDWYRKKTSVLTGQ